MSTQLFRKYINVIAESEAQNVYQGEFEPRQLQPNELQVLQGKAVQGWISQLGLNLASATPGLYNMDSGAQVPGLAMKVSSRLDSETFDEMRRALGGIGVMPVMSGGTLYLVKSR
jgi:hypothetical protein